MPYSGWNRTRTQAIPKEAKKEGRAEVSSQVIGYPELEGTIRIIESSSSFS